MAHREVPQGDAPLSAPLRRTAPSLATHLAGDAFLALWNDVEPGRQCEYESWHTLEHVPERVAVRGILSGRRYVRAEGAAISPFYFTLYDLDRPSVLESSDYVDLLRSPTRWSAEMRPSLRRFTRIPCRREFSLGNGIGGAVAVIRAKALSGEVRLALALLMNSTGITAVHLGKILTDISAHPLEGAAEQQEGHVILVEATSAEALTAVLPTFCKSNIVDALIETYRLAFLSLGTPSRQR